jgi:Uma2 family endonuclease
MIANLQNQFMTPAEYLVWEAEQPIRHEYIDGEVYAMAGGTLPHNDIALNVYLAKAANPDFFELTSINFQGSLSLIYEDMQLLQVKDFM